ncbi:PREDICTED: uncharacterized protein LOC104612120 isoform X2 [Nelumbo nucifera]|uniref:Uncharacterized protein LOC104612120 isoform X2 n=2 Tax=Nelumbo nucifera TaxID=4432 RepID=A0A1U8B990_NELNU|nr:PREDICTED: uncharacterized protein LOC104612120 isoform X2 [Nelumbo nucifera]DAD24804.1 TPA_asm: hypothetical protein HUJ06_026268 [Nelumbo nucifera]
MMPVATSTLQQSCLGGDEMEQKRRDALTWYQGCCPQIKNLAGEFFRNMDTDGDGSISIIEFRDFLSKTEEYHYDSNIFYKLDRNRDGVLDFNEIIVFFYMTKDNQPPRPQQTRSLSKVASRAVEGLQTRSLSKVASRAQNVLEIIDKFSTILDIASNIGMCSIM